MSRQDPPPQPRAPGRSAALAVVLARALHMLDRTRTFGRDTDLVQLVELDAVLRGSVTRVLRCPVYATPVHAELALPAALERLGPDVLNDTFLAAVPDDVSRDPSHVEVRCRNWLHGVAVAAASRWLANQGEYADPDEAYVAGLAHVLCHSLEHHDQVEIGDSAELVADLRLGARVAEVVRRADLFHASPSDADLARGPTPIDASTIRLFRVVARGDALADSLGFGMNASTVAADDGEEAAVSDAIALELAHAAGLLGMRPATMQSLVEQLTALEVRALQDDAADVPRQRRRGSNLVQVATAHHAIVELRSIAAIPEIINRGIDLLHRDLGFDRLVVVEREHSNPSAARVRAVACRTRLAGPGFRSHAELPVASRGALDRVFDGELSAMSDAGTDLGALRFLGAHAFAAAALRAGSGAMGAVLGDHFVSGRRISPDDVAALAVAASALGMVLENAALHAEGKTLRSLAERDSLTGINNRRNVLEILRREIDRSRRYGKPLAVAMIDVDHFKSWNDHHGHQVGDTVLQTVAQIISSTGREIDSCGRYGGEEFLVILPETPAEHAVLYADRLRVAIELHGADLSTVYAGLALSVSIGVTQLLPRGDDADQMIHRADVALYQAKERGRNMVCVEWSAQPSRVATPFAKGIVGDSI